MSEYNTEVQIKSFDTRKWFLICLISLLLVATLGVLMRYKILYSLPFVNQKNLQHAHSHFAFTGWVSQSLFVLITSILHTTLSSGRLRRYKQLLSANLFTAFGMLVSFSIQGYGFYSITFSTLSIIIAIYYSLLLFRDIQATKILKQKQWINAGMLFNLISTLGTAALVFMMVTHRIPQEQYLASVYWFLHFQYNGWFLFGCAGLFVHYLTSIQQIPAPPLRVFWLFATSCIPAYGLSILWMHIPTVLYGLVVAASFAQVAGWVILLAHLRRHRIFSRPGVDWLARILWWSVAVALTIKLGLQLASVIPAVSKLAFGFRPIVIAYLHLVLLAIITLFIVGYAYLQGLLRNSPATHGAILLFTAGVFINEAILGVQGIASFSYTSIPHINLFLFIVAIILFAGILMLLWAQGKKRKQELPL